ncbi:MAG: hypothetical protein FD127_4354, partial [Acidimicrobiaceae bacterium]
NLITNGSSDSITIASGSHAISTGDGDETFTISGGTVAVDSAGTSSSLTVNITGGSGTLELGQGTNQVSFATTSTTTNAAWEVLGDTSGTDTIVLPVVSTGQQIQANNHQLVAPAYKIDFNDEIELIQLSDTAAISTFVSTSTKADFGNVDLELTINELVFQPTLNAGRLDVDATGDVTFEGDVVIDGDVDIDSTAANAVFTFGGNLQATGGGHIDVRREDLSNPGASTTIAVAGNIAAVDFVRLTAATTTVGGGVTADSIVIQTRDTYTVNQTYSAVDQIDIRVFGDDADIVLKAGLNAGNSTRLIAPDGTVLLERQTTDVNVADALVAGNDITIAGATFQDHGVAAGDVLELADAARG